MKWITTKKALLTALDPLARVIPTRSSNPALTALSAVPTPDGLVLCGTNLEIDLRMPVPCEVGLLDTPRDVWGVPAHLFHQTVKKLSGEIVELELQGRELAVRCAGNTTKVQTTASETLPRFEFPNHGDGQPLDGPAFAGGLRSVIYAAMNEAFQAVFRGILVRQSRENTLFVASDGFRIATYAAALGVAAGAERDAIVPHRNCEELARVLDAPDTQVHFADGMLSVTRKDGAALNVKLLDGDFPDFDRVIPKSITVTLECPGTLLLEAIDRVSLYASSNSNNRTEFLIGEGRVRLLGEGDYGRAEEVVEATLGGSEPALSIALNAKHALDALKQMGPGDVRIEFAGSIAPVIFRSKGNPAPMAVTVALRV